MSIELLLPQVSDISKKYDLISKTTGGYFNIFDITNTATDEVTICRVLHELLNPRGTHCQGDTYLRLFDKHVLRLNLNDREFASAKVYREYVIAENRRIDLVVQTASYFIPIEVKIHAGDQYEQCYAYSRKAKNSNVYYLTLEGNPPSVESAGKLTPDADGYKEITQISFKNEILSWIDDCIDEPVTAQIPAIHEVLKQLAALIRRLTNQMNENKEMDIQKILKGDIKSAFEIENAIKSMKTAMLKKVLSSIEKGLDIGYEKIKDSEYDYERNKSKIDKYYDNRADSTYPGFSYKIDSLGKGIDLWLRIEIWEDIYVGLCTPVNGKHQGPQLDKKDIKKRFPNIELDNKDDNIAGWWIYYEMLPSDDDESPDFWSFNDAYYALFDDRVFAEFVDKSVATIKELLKKVS